MSVAGTPGALAPAADARRRPALPAWWPLVALTALGALLRFSTLNLQSFWYDEAFTPVHVLHPSLWATLRSVVHSENTPPLWYVIAWADARVFGDGEIALRWPSALAGTATVPLAWAIARELSGRRAPAVVAAALVAVSPLFVWYSQEARAYALFVFTSALAMLCFVRARAQPTGRRLAAFALSGSLALMTHYFAAFLLVGMASLLLADVVRGRGSSPEPAFAGASRRAGRRSPAAASGGARWRTIVADPRVVAVGVIAAVGLALVPLVFAQGGHGTQWIGRWALADRLQAIPQYYLTDYYGAALGHGIELLVALPILAGLGLGLWRVLEPREERGALVALLIAACGVLIPIALVAFGADYLAPRNLVAAMVPVTVLIAVVTASRRAARTGTVLAMVIVLAFAAVSVDVFVSPRLQRGNWRGLAKALSAPAGGGAAVRGALAGSGASAPGRELADGVIVSVQLGAAPLQYYLPELRSIAGAGSLTVSKIDEVGYAPLRPFAGAPPAAGFRVYDRLNVNGLIAYRFISAVPRAVSEKALRRHTITSTRTELLIGTGHGPPA